MTDDLESWSPGEASEFERRLLAAGRAEQIPSALQARMAAALGASAGASASESASPSASPTPGVDAAGSAGGLLFSKTGMWGVLTLALIAGAAGFQALRSSTPARAARDVPATEIELAAMRPPPIPPRAEPLIPNHPPTTQASASGAASTPVPLADATQLRAEIALLDRARRALRKGESGAAVQLLAQHEHRFTPAALAPEADALRIEVLLQRGEHARAEARADRFFAAYPTHPLTERITHLLAAAP